MNRFKWITQCFPQPYEIQKSMFPDLVNVADQLAVEWELAMDEVDDARLTDDQMQAIKALDDYMLSISEPANLKYWNDDALRHSNEWDNTVLPENGVMYITK
ncbi:hypothetical protein [Dickeya zeae]|uniref:hypothetical protein n=1 Tax=Dickeya zeae TaxID=204042 RepID=UPI0006AD0189|nr:hypothetical protein [Dickeya zeae]